jgi:lipoprotein-anchoring transpeptidase ErfK/SrfK
LPYSYAIKNYEVKIEAPKDAVTPLGTTDIRVLLNAPSPEIEVVGKHLFAKIVIDIANNTLYKYDEYGFPLKAYLVATGARGTRTMAGLRIVTYKEKFPYKGAPKDCKRLFDPYSYGPYIIFMNRVNPKTGRQIYVDQFLHGNGNERSIGRKVSHGCIRTNNTVMRQELSKEVNRGDYVLLINPDRN